MRGMLYDIIPLRVVSELESYCPPEKELCIKIVIYGMVRNDNVPYIMSKEMKRVVYSILYFRYRMQLVDIAKFVQVDGKPQVLTSVWDDVSKFTNAMIHPNSQKSLYKLYCDTIKNLREYAEFSKSLDTSEGFSSQLESELGDKRLLVAALALNNGTPVNEVCATYLVTKTELMEFYNKKKQEYAQKQLYLSCLSTNEKI